MLHILWQELRIQQILSRPFKVPLPDYKGNSIQTITIVNDLLNALGLNSGLGRCLGMRSRGMKCALHDPHADGALVLFTPCELTAHEKLTVDK